MMRPVYFALGWLSVVIGVIGIVTPLLPSTPFLLLAAGCFARSSDRFHHWLMTHPRLSRPILDWQKDGVIRKPAKIIATVFIVINAAFPLFIIQKIPGPLRLIVALVMLAVLTFIWSRPSVPRPEPKENS